MGTRQEDGEFSCNTQERMGADKDKKQIGALHRLNLEELLEAALLGLLVRVENWKPEEVNVFIAQIRTALRDKSVHAMQE